MSDVYLFERKQDSTNTSNSDAPVKREVDHVADAADVDFLKEGLQGDPRVGFVLEQVLLPRQPRGYNPPTDPEWANQWTLVCLNTFHSPFCILNYFIICALIPVQLNRGQVGLEYIGRDMNIEPVWMQGITGLNVTVAVVDDGKHHIATIAISTHADSSFYTY